MKKTEHAIMIYDLVVLVLAFIIGRRTFIFTVVYTLGKYQVFSSFLSCFNLIVEFLFVQAPSAIFGWLESIWIYWYPQSPPTTSNEIWRAI